MSQPAEPAAKKQKTSVKENGPMLSHEANLEIEIGGDGQCGGETKVTRFYNSAVLANKSKYIDAMLASPMRESETYKISFVDTPVKTFELALKFVLIAVEARKMTVRDAIKVAKFYDQYNFTDGLELCDHVLFEYFEDLPEQEKHSTVDPDLLVRAVGVAFVANLTQAYPKGSAYIKQKMSLQAGEPCPQTFGAPHIKKLVPVIADLAEKDNSFLQWVTGSGTTFDKQKIESRLFPEFYAASASRFSAINRLVSKGKIQVSESGNANINGVYAGEPRRLCFTKRSPVMVGDTHFGKVVVGLTHTEGWSLQAVNGNARVELWRAKYSACLPLPPKDNWKPVHPFSEGSSLKIEYSEHVRDTLS